MTPAQHNEILQEFENLVAKIERMAGDNAKSDYGTFITDGKKEIDQLKTQLADLTKENRYYQRQLEIQKLENRRIKERMAMKDKAKREAFERAAKNFSTTEKQPQMPHWTSKQVEKTVEKGFPEKRVTIIDNGDEVKIQRTGFSENENELFNNLLKILGYNLKEEE